MESRGFVLRWFSFVHPRDLFHEFCVIEESKFVTCTCIENLASFDHKVRHETHLCGDAYDELERILLCLHQHDWECISKKFRSKITNING